MPGRENVDLSLYKFAGHISVGFIALILMEASSAADPGGRLVLGPHAQDEEEPSGAAPPPHAQVPVGSTGTRAPLSRGVVHQAGEGLLHRQRKAAPPPVRNAMAPYRNNLAVGVEWLFTWDLARRPLRPRGPARWAGTRPLPRVKARRTP